MIEFDPVTNSSVITFHASDRQKKMIRCVIHSLTRFILNIERMSSDQICKTDDDLLELFLLFSRSTSSFAFEFMLTDVNFGTI